MALSRRACRADIHQLQLSHSMPPSKRLRLTDGLAL
jgi:hypothetical protein